MPAGSESPPLPARFRPLGVRIATIAFGSLLIGVGSAMWFSFPDDVRDAFTVSQRLTEGVEALSSRASCSWVRPSRSRSALTSNA